MTAIAQIYFAVFGLLTLAGGIMGYVKANSLPSLIAGGVAGILLMVGAWLITWGARPILMGLGLISLALAVRFVPIFLDKKAFMPGGLMAILSVIGVIAALCALFVPSK
jgi:uncharacterized membrane protein (UPF0136 family)